MFYIDGISSKQLGIIAEEENFFSRAPVKYDELSISGKDGNDYNELNYGNVTDTMILYAENNRIDNIKRIFTGPVKITKDRRTCIFRFYDTAVIERFGYKKKITLQYIREPFWYSEYDTYNEVKNTIFNAGNTISFPLIKMIGYGTVQIKINDITFQYSFENGNEVVIDCLYKEESYNGKSKSRFLKIGFEYPFLNPGINKIDIDGDVKVYVCRKDRWL